MPKLIANLNYVLALVVVGATIAIGLIAPQVKLLFVHPGEINQTYYNTKYIAIALVIGLVSAAWWIGKSLVPNPITTNAKLMLRIGTVAMTIGNGAITLALLVSLIGVAVNREFGLMVGFIFAAAFILAFPLNIVGTICVEISRLLNKGQSSRPRE